MLAISKTFRQAHIRRSSLHEVDVMRVYALVQLVLYATRLAHMGKESDRPPASSDISSSSQSIAHFQNEIWYCVEGGYCSKCGFSSKRLSRKTCAKTKEASGFTISLTGRKVAYARRTSSKGSDSMVDEQRQDASSAQRRAAGERCRVRRELALKRT